MNALQTPSRIERPLVGRPAHQELAAPSRAEIEEASVTGLSEAFGRLCDAANSFDHARARSAFDGAIEALGMSGSDADVDRVLDEVHSTLVRGSEPATRKQVAEAVASLIGAFPNFGNKSESRLFGGALAEDVAAAQPTAMALSIMVRKIRRKSRFMPTISEVLAELHAAGQAVDRGWLVLQHFDERWRQARSRVEKLAGDHARWLADRVSEYRAALASGANVRGFPAEVIAAANSSGDDIPF